LDSSLQHKWMALLTFERICRTPHLLLDLFANYDCDEFMTNIFERMVNSLSK
jgi:brefeldin A-inhibited guanine nucleotide-exchange protein